MEAVFFNFRTSKMYIMPSAEGGIFLPFKGEKKHIKHYILWYEFFALHRYRGYPDFKVLILFLPESTEGVAVGAAKRMRESIPDMCGRE